RVVEVLGGSDGEEVELQVAGRGAHRGGTREHHASRAHAEHIQKVIGDGQARDIAALFEHGDLDTEVEHAEQRSCAAKAQGAVYGQTPKPRVELHAPAHAHADSEE